MPTFNGIVIEDTAQLASQQAHRAELASAAGAAYDRLLTLAETRDSGQIARIAGFIAATFNWHEYRWDWSDIRCLDLPIAADFLAVLAYQASGGNEYPYNLAPNGEKRAEGVVKAWKGRF